MSLLFAAIRDAHQNGRIASLIGVEGGHTLGNSLAVLRMYYGLGARYLTLTHTCDTPWWVAAGALLVLYQAGGRDAAANCCNLLQTYFIYSPSGDIIRIGLFRSRIESNRISKIFTLNRIELVRSTLIPDSIRLDYDSNISKVTCLCPKRVKCVISIFVLFWPTNILFESWNVCFVFELNRVGLIRFDSDSNCSHATKFPAP